MTDQPVVENVSTEEILKTLQTRFGENAVTAEDRVGFEGIVVDPSVLVDVATALRDDMGYDYLSSATAVDYLGWGDHMEMVYHLYNIREGLAGKSKPMVVKAKTSRDNATLPSLISVYPGADFQEREAWDLYGIYFEGHPNLKRILMWEGFEGHPMRKDWKEPYYEEEHKPFGSRWPNGHVYRHEEKNPYGSNVKYPPGFMPENARDKSESANYSGLGLGVEIEGLGKGIKTDKLVVNLGPHHPSTHGVFRMVVEVNGETIEHLEPVMGYLHRNHEQIGERNAWIMNMPFTDRLDYISGMPNNLGYALAVEKLMARGVKGYVAPTRRAELIRVLMVELARIVNHVWATGFFLNDLGAFQTPMLYLVKERELILDFFEAVTGSRLMNNYMRFGGVARDVPDRLYWPAVFENDRLREANTWDFLKEIIFERLPAMAEQMSEYLVGNEILVARTQGVGILPPEMAIAYSVAGPLLRASGVPYDIRKAEPYSLYSELDFDVAVRYNGDCYDRMMIRFDEIGQSIRILQQVWKLLQETDKMPVLGIESYSIRMPQGESYGRSENPKGEIGFYCVARGVPDPEAKDHDQNPWRYHIRSPSFINLTALGEMCVGHKVADVVVILGSIDIVLGEVDR